MESAEDPAPLPCSSSSDIVTVPSDIECVEDVGLSTPAVKVLRCNVSDAAAAEQWMQKYSAQTNTSWIVQNASKKCTRMVFHKTWACQHSEINKTAAKRNQVCQAKVDIKIKKVNKDTRKKDPFLCRPVPLPAIVKLTVPHSHATKSAEALRMLRASPETKATFQKYFEAGLAPSAAIRLHESLLSARHDGPMLLANGSVNPIKSDVYRWHQEWRANQFGPPRKSFCNTAREGVTP